MKIKRKVEMNLPQLIEWAWENDDATGVRFQSDGFVTTVYFGKNGDVSVEDCSKDARFTVEVEEEITEDTVIPEILAIFSDGTSDLTNNKSLNYLIRETSLKSAYIMNDDLRLILIWKHEKGLVE